MLVLLIVHIVPPQLNHPLPDLFLAPPWQQHVHLIEAQLAVHEEVILLVAPVDKESRGICIRARQRGWLVDPWVAVNRGVHSGGGRVMVTVVVVELLRRRKGVGDGIRGNGVGGGCGYRGHFGGEGGRGGCNSGRAAVALVVFQLTRSKATPAELAGVRSAATEVGRDFFPTKALLLLELLEKDVILGIPGHRSARSLRPRGRVNIPFNEKLRNSDLLLAAEAVVTVTV